jgi:hypothetical protein
MSDVLDIRHDQLVADRTPIFTDMEYRLTLRLRFDSRDFLSTFKAGDEVTL